MSIISTRLGTRLAGVGVIVAVTMAVGAGTASADLTWGAPAALLPDQTRIAISCPSIMQCTSISDPAINGHAIPGEGYEVTFVPGTQPVQIISSYPIEEPSTNFGRAVDCPTTTQCTTVDDAGEEITPR